MDDIQDLEQKYNQEEDLNYNDKDYPEEQQQALDENSQRMIQLQKRELPPKDMYEEVKPVKNPISPYMMFVGSWKERHPNEKFNMATLGQIWRDMSLPEKQPYQTEYKQKRKIYEQYQALLQLQNPNQANKEVSSKFLIPLSRIRAIMRQDTYYAPKTEAYSAMAKAAEYFADYFLEQVKRMSEGKNRIDHRLLYQCINNQRSFSFLQCLIQEYNLQNGETKQKKNKPEVRLEMEQAVKPSRAQNPQQNKTKNLPTARPVNPKVSGKQLSLDSFFSKQR